MKNTDSKEPKNSAFGHNPLTHGMTIKSAINGESTEYISGTMSELNMFRVTDCTGKIGAATKYFYKNPEEYEKSRGVTLNAELKASWFKKQC